MSQSLRTFDIFKAKIDAGDLILCKEKGTLHTKQGRQLGSPSKSNLIQVATAGPEPKRSLKTILLHRLMWEYFNGPVPKGFYVKMKDGDKNNCSLDNLYLDEMANSSGMKEKDDVKLPTPYRAIHPIPFKDMMDAQLKLRIADKATKVGIKNFCAMSGFPYGVIKSIVDKRGAV